MDETSALTCCSACHLMSETRSGLRDTEGDWGHLRKSKFQFRGFYKRSAIIGVFCVGSSEGTDLFLT